MRLLLDTHVLLWVRTNDPALPSSFREALADPEHQKLVSAISLAEIAVKRAIGKLRVPEGFRDGLRGVGLDELPFTGAHAAVLDRLPLLHRDPFDRMLIAQAIEEEAVFLTVDPACLRYEVRALSL